VEGQKQNSETKECEPECEENFYYDRQSQGEKCVEKCSEPNYGIESTRTCEEECGDETLYPDDEERMCVPCASACLTCDGEGEDHCTSCLDEL